MQEVRRSNQFSAPAAKVSRSADIAVRELLDSVGREVKRSQLEWLRDEDQKLADAQAISDADYRQKRRIYEESLFARERKRQEEEKALETPLGRILDARKRGAAPSVNDRIQHAIHNRNWTPFDIQRWDHGQGFGVILRLKQIDEYLKRGRK
jgi:hypothetical protein